MKRFLSRIFCLLLALVLTLSCVPAGMAYEKGDSCQLDLSAWIKDASLRTYVQMMVDYYIRTEDSIQTALDGGFAAMFLFDGCSDKMRDPVLSDLSFYRVSGVCIVIRKDEKGALRLVYFNDNCSTIPDRPLEYGAWSLPDVGDVGHATICDGTYELYSVMHKGRYQALNVRTGYRDPLINAIYMTPNGFTLSRASEINVHTRTGNHIIQGAMWSAGCPLVGAGKPWEFWKLMDSVYYSSFEDFETDTFVGTLTVDRQMLRYELFALYEDPEAVDAALAKSSLARPVNYLEDCRSELYNHTAVCAVKEDTRVMSLPCTNDQDARSVEVTAVAEGTQFIALGIYTNPQSERWYQLDVEGTLCYIQADAAKKRNRIVVFLESLFGA